MAHFLRNNDDEVLEGNKYYWKWKITKLLPEYVPIQEKKFKLHSMTWTYAAKIIGEFLYIYFRHVSNTDSDYFYRFFEIRVGILGDDLKEIVAVSTQVPLYEKLISSSQLDSILRTNKVLYLFVEIEKKDENGQKIKLRRQRIEADFKELLISGRSSDVTIEVKRKKFNCHRCILGARSAVFAAMFDQDMKGKNSGLVTIEDVEPDVFKEFLLYLYSGNDNLLSWKNVAELYKLADKYGMEDLKTVCTNDINENISYENFIDFFKLSRLHNDSRLTEIAIQTSLKHSSPIVRLEDWATYLSENPVECNIVINTLSEYSIKVKERANTYYHLLHKLKITS